MSPFDTKITLMSRTQSARNTWREKINGAKTIRHFDLESNKVYLSTLDSAIVLTSSFSRCTQSKLLPLSAHRFQGLSCLHGEVERRLQSHQEVQSGLVGVMILLVLLLLPPPDLTDEQQSENWSDYPVHPSPRLAWYPISDGSWWFKEDDFPLSISMK